MHRVFIGVDANDYKGKILRLAEHIKRVIIYTALLTVSKWAFSLGSAALIDRDALVVALPFDEGVGDEAKDVSPHGNHAVLVEGARWGNGKFGKCLKVKEPARAEVANSESFHLHGTDFTLAMWMNFSNEPGVFGFIGHDDGGAAQSKKAVWEFLGGTLVFHINRADNSVDWLRSEFIGTPELNRWYHAALVRKGKQYTHYLDGELFGEQKAKEEIPEGINNPLTIGMTEHYLFFDGLIDEAVVAHQAWTYPDVLKHYNGGIQGILPVEPGAKLAVAWGGLKTNRSFRN